MDFKIFYQNQKQNLFVFLWVRKTIIVKISFFFLVVSYTKMNKKELIFSHHILISHFSTKAIYTQTQTSEQITS